MTTKLMTKQSRSYNQHQLKIFCDQLCDRIDELLAVFDIHNIKHNGKMLVGACPIHDGDNKTAFNLYPEGDSYRGNWKCRTHNCDKVFKSSIIGFIRGLLSNKQYNWQSEGDKTATFDETIEFIEEFIGHSLNSVKLSNSQIEKNMFTTTIQNIVDKKICINNKIKRQNVRQSLSIPSDYFLDRGFDKSILDKYDVGLCNKPEKEMFNRAVAPIYDIDNEYMVGCTGRSIFEKCNSCSSFHDPNHDCPPDNEKWKYSKWKHSYKFQSQNHLYNFWFAKESILRSTKVILVESPGNVWKLEENGIHNSVGLFGSSLSDKQKILLDSSGAMTIIIVMDNDEAGHKAAELIKNKCKNTYNIIDVKITKPDVAEMTPEEINQQIKIHL